MVSRVNRLVSGQGDEDNWRGWDHITNHNYLRCHSNSLHRPLPEHIETYSASHSAMSLSSSDRRWSKFNGIKSRCVKLARVMKPRSAHTRAPLSKMWFNEILAAAASRDAGKWVIMTVLMWQFRSNVALCEILMGCLMYEDTDYWLPTCRISFN